MAGSTTVRNIRAYRDRGLLPPPRRQGRVAVYSDAHLGRLRLIADLLDRGYTLQSIGELLAAWERGKDIGEVLGLEAVLSTPWTDEEPVTMTRAELDNIVGGPLTDAHLRATIELGMIEPLEPSWDRPGESRTAAFVVHSRSQLDAAGRLVTEGVPLDAVIDEGRHVHEHIDRVAAAFVQLVTKHVVEPIGDDPAQMAASIERLRPLAAAVVSAELSRAMAHHVQQAVEAWLATASSSPGVAPETPEADADR